MDHNIYVRKIWKVQEAPVAITLPSDSGSQVSRDISERIALLYAHYRPMHALHFGTCSPVTGTNEALNTHSTRFPGSWHVEITGLSGQLHTTWQLGHGLATQSLIAQL